MRARDALAVDPGHGRHYADRPMKLVEQWREIESGLDDGWESVGLVVTTEQPDQLARAAQVLAPLSAGKRGDELVFSVRRAGGAQGPEAARRLFARLDEARVWCLLRSTDQTVRAEPPTGDDTGTATPAAASTARSWDVQAALLPPGWSDVLCELELDSSDHLPRAALLCAPLNPTKVRERTAFTFRCSGADGYGASPGMVRRCCERLDAEGIHGIVTVLQTRSDADNVATQGTVWLMGGKTL
jgi:hypothetical protein